MKDLVYKLRRLFRSDFAKKGDEIRAASRAEVARMSHNGEAWAGMRANAGLMGIRSDAHSRTRIVSLRR